MTIMNDCIERKKVLELINLFKRDDVVKHCVDYAAGWNEALEQIESCVTEDIPVADVHPERFREWVDVCERLPKDSSKWEHYIVTVISPRIDYKLWHEEPYDEVFVLPALYDSKQKIWQIDWGNYKEELNALITTENSARNENVVVYWTEYPEPLEIPGTLHRGKNDGDTEQAPNEIKQSDEILF